jgi:AmmeMemoRadiSam system protein B
MKTRIPAVAGRFYPDTADELNIQLAGILRKERENIDLELARNKILGAIVPHAGYIYSAYQALHFFEILRRSKEQFDTFFIINPNHTGFGPETALDENDYWESPYGVVEIDKLFHGFLEIPESADAHKFEHSGEVMLPLLQYSLDYAFKIVPVTMLRQTPQNATRIAKAIVDANKHLHKKICVIASSDFSHFVEPEVGRRLDQYVIRNILDFNTEGIFREIHQKHITVCGYGPIMTLIEYVKLVSEDPYINILKTGHSGEVHQSSEVVDYVCALFYEKQGL